jgi:SsrA-binding protein
MEILSENKKAYFNYEIIKKFQAGIVLNGFEVKSIKKKKMSLAGAFVHIQQSPLAAFLVGSHVPAYQPANTPKEYNPERSRKLLLNKEELNELIGKSKGKGLTIIPLNVYTERSKIKLTIALGKGKRKIDKRDAIKKRDSQREIERALKRG